MGLHPPVWERGWHSKSSSTLVSRPPLRALSAPPLVPPPASSVLATVFASCRQHMPAVLTVTAIAMVVAAIGHTLAPPESALCFTRTHALTHLWAHTHTPHSREAGVPAVGTQLSSPFHRVRVVCRLSARHCEGPMPSPSPVRRGGSAYFVVWTDAVAGDPCRGRCNALLEQHPRTAAAGIRPPLPPPPPSLSRSAAPSPTC